MKPEKRQPLWVAKILDRPYAVTTPSGDLVRFRVQSEAHDVSRSMRWVYSVFLADSRSWVPVGIID